MFKGGQFDQSVILLCVRWYLAYNLSLHDLEEVMAERGHYGRSHDHPPLDGSFLALVARAFQPAQA